MIRVLYGFLVWLVLTGSAQAVVNSTTDQVQYTGNGSVASYSVPFKFFQNADLYVSENANGTITQQLLGINYTLTGAGIPSGGTLTLTGGNLAIGVVLTIFRNPAQTQTVSLPNGSPYFGSTIEGALDLATMQIQSNRSYIQRSIQFPVGDSAIAVLPAATVRASQYLGFDSSGNAIAIAANNASGTAVTATGSTTPRLLADRFANIYNVKDYGALGNGSTDDTAAIQSCLNIIQANGGTVYIPPGNYVVSSTLTMVGTTNGLIGGTITGAGYGITNILPTSSVAGLPVFKITDCRGTEIDGLYINGCVGSPVLCGVQYYATGASPGSTNNRVRNCWIGNAATNSMTDGIQWSCAGGDGGSGDVDNDGSIIDSCNFNNLSSNGLHILHSNSLWHKIENCTFYNCPVGINAATGSFNAMADAFACTSYDFSLGTISTTTLYHASLATNCNSEANNGVHGYYALIGAAPAASLTLVNCERQGSISGTGDFIQCSSVGAQLTIIGCTLITGQSNTLAMLAAGRLTIIGSQIGLQNVTYNGRWTTMGNWYLSGAPTDTDGGTSSVMQVGDANASSPAIYNGLRGNTVALSGAKTTGATQNLRGSLLFTGSTGEQTVTFPQAEKDANYFITLSGGYVSGSQVNSSLKTAWASKGASGFAVLLPDGTPGAGNTVEVDWMISR